MAALTNCYKGQEFVLTRVTLILGIGLPFLPAESSSQHHYLVSHRVPDPQAWIPNNVVSDQKTHFTAKWEWAHNLGIHQPYHRRTIQRELTWECITAAYQRDSWWINLEAMVCLQRWVPSSRMFECALEYMGRIYGSWNPRGCIFARGHSMSHIML